MNAVCELSPVTAPQSLDGLSQSNYYVYQVNLIEFTSLSYSRLAQHILQDSGEYLQALDQLLQVEDQSIAGCHRLYKHLLLRYGRVADFSIALAGLRKP
ncbi:MAG: hypothetical protein ACJA0N_001347 [Pseudohongiellaceae bacterium]|jgi:hypothetical protein